MNLGRLHNDDGYSLSELLVVLGLIGLVLSGAFALFRLTSMGAAQSSREAMISREIGQPLENIERFMLQQAPPMITVDRYVCEIKTDQDRDNHYEYHRFEATADGFLRETYHEDIDRPALEIRTWSRTNANVVQGVPLFTYFDIDGTDISAEEIQYIKTYAASAVITIVTDQNGETYQDSRRVFFRNR
ncbi:MAG: hypothetical protein ACYCXR_09940 [Coriobacteriia bacterium]